MGIRLGLLKNNTLDTTFVYYPHNILQICKILNDNYTKSSSIEDLLNLGDIHTLGKDIESTTFYHRDKGDPMEGCVKYSETCNSLDDVDVFRSPVEYYLIWTNKWNIFEVSSTSWTSIKKFINKHKTS